jgi:hypothetical protein
MAVLNFPHLETISAPMQDLLAWLGKQRFLRRFYLAGGTALALHLGHRRSMGPDFFSETDPVHEPSRREIIAILAKRNGQVIENTARKYPQLRDFALMSLESMVCFDNADRDNPTELLVEIPWDTVRAFFITKVKRLGKDWFWSA